MAIDRLPAKHFRTEAWRDLKGAIARRIGELRLQNDSLQNTEQTTAATRGRIAELSELLALETAPAEAPRAGDEVHLGRAPVEVVTSREQSGM